MRGRRAWAPAAVSLALALAPSAAHAAEAVEPFAVTASDGTVLRGDVYVPQGRGRVGTVLNLSPYWNTAHSPQSYGRSEAQLAMRASSLQGALVKFLDAGFAVALVNMRGTGKSDGCFQYGDPLDWHDAYSIVQGIAAAPWSNGSVGMYGGSYHGWSQYMAMATMPPALKAVAPFSGIIDLWSLVTRLGANFAGGAQSDPTALEAQTSLGSLDPAAFGRPACAQTTQAHAAAYADLVATGDKTEYWQRRDLRRAIKGSPVPAFVANGLTTPGEGHLTQFDGLWDGLLAPERTRLLLGQWDHDWPSNHRTDYLDMLVAFFDQYLRDGPARLKLGVVEYQDDASKWHTAESWPPPGQRVALRLSGTALLPQGASPQASEQTYQSSPEDTGARCGAHEAVFASAPFAQDALIAGNFRLDVTLSSNNPGGNLVAVLLHGTGAGDCQSVATGAAESGGRVEMDLRHWAEHGKSRDFPVGTPTRVTVDSEPLVTRVHKGERIFLALGGGSTVLFPRALPQVTVRTGPGMAGSITLPVVREAGGAAGGSASAAAGEGVGRDGRCRDVAAPRSSFVRGSLRVSGRGLRVRGRSTDRVCGVASVRVALARDVGRGRCRFLTARRGFARARSCRRARFLSVRGARTWTFAQRVRLGPGRYRLIARAADTAGNVESAGTRRMLQFVIR